MTPLAQEEAVLASEILPRPKKDWLEMRRQSYNSAGLAVLLFLIGVIAELYACLVATQGVFCYTLDDGYIHLALAERIAHGTYGLNFHEFSAPSSSILWPFFLLIGVGTPWHVYVPLALNVVFGGMAAWFIGKCVNEWPWEKETRFGTLKRTATVFVFVVGLNLIGLTFQGMEHPLQVLLAVICAYGILQVHRGREMPLWCIAAACIGPMVRYESVAITVAVAVVLYRKGSKRTAIWCLLTSLAVPLIFSVFLLAHGSSVLPNSVLMKGTQGAGVTGFLGSIWANLVKDLTQYTRLCWLFVLFLPAELWWQNRRSRPAAVAAVTIVLGLALVFGKVGSFRYESFFTAFATLVLFAVLGDRYRKQWHLAMIVFMVCNWPYFWYVYKTPVASENIYQQQYQMARFVHDYYKKNVAVNDIGLVSYRLPQETYVVDMAGLASRESLLQQDRSAEWVDDFTRRHGAGLAMIYTDWVNGIPPSWTLLGRLVLGSDRVAPAENNVDIYATGIGEPAEIDAELRAFQRTMPPGVGLLLRQPVAVEASHTGAR